MFACQKFLQQSCSNFYREQKLFYGHLMKMITSSSKVTHKADLGLFPTLMKMITSKSGDAAVCLIDFENFISFKQGWSGSCSSWQCCRTQLVLQLCQLRHLLTRFGLEDNHRWSCSVRRSMPCLNRTRARRRGRPATELRRHLLPIRRSWPRSSAPSARMTATAMPRT